MSNLTNVGQRFETEYAWRGSTEFSGLDFYIGLTNATITKTSTLEDAEATEPLGRVSAPGALGAALAGAGAGNLSNGNYKYKVTFTNVAGETEAGTATGNITVTDNNADGKIALSSIPLGVSGVVTGRKIYRTEVNGSAYKLLTTLSDNTTTTFLDNVADGNLTTDAPAGNSTEGMNGYARQILTKDATGFPTSALSAGDWEIMTKTFAFAATDGVIGPFKTVFLSDAENNGDGGNLYAWWDLSETRTLLPLESFSWAGKMKKK